MKRAFERLHILGLYGQEPIPLSRFFTAYDLQYYSLHDGGQIQAPESRAWFQVLEKSNDLVESDTALYVFSLADLNRLVPALATVNVKSIGAPAASGSYTTEKAEAAIKDRKRLFSKLLADLKTAKSNNACVSPCPYGSHLGRDRFAWAFNRSAVFTAPEAQTIRDYLGTVEELRKAFREYGPRIALHHGRKAGGIEHHVSVSISSEGVPEDDISKFGRRLAARARRDGVIAPGVRVRWILRP